MHRFVALAALPFAFSLAACGDNAPADDAADAAEDAAADAAPIDAAADVPEDSVVQDIVDADEDVPEDIPPDLEVDVAPDIEEDVESDAAPTEAELEAEAKALCEINPGGRLIQCSTSGRLRASCGGDDRHELISWELCDTMCAFEYGCMPDAEPIDCASLDLSEGAVNFCFVASGNDFSGFCGDGAGLEWRASRCTDANPYCWPSRGTCEFRPPDPGEE